MLSLILLNTDKERRKLPSYLLEKSGSMVQPSGQTLLVCPQAIVKQWQDEIERHAPTLRVLRYEGMSTTFPREINMKKFLKDYDIVLCTFDVLTAEVAIARKPVIHTTRGNSHKPEHERINYRRSLLVGVDWLRVIIDEARRSSRSARQSTGNTELVIFAEMAASTTSAISETASLIPRKYSWGVSGTPIKQTIADRQPIALSLLPHADDLFYQWQDCSNSYAYNGSKTAVFCLRDSYIHLSQTSSLDSYPKSGSALQRRRYRTSSLFHLNLASSYLQSFQL